MSRGAIVAYAVGTPVAFVGLLFLPAGSLAWAPGWIFLGVFFLAIGVSTAVIARVNPIIFRARSRFQPGTKAWDKRLVTFIMASMMAILPLAALDAGRFHWSAAPPWVVPAGYAAIVVAIAGTAWAQGVNPFFEPGVRIQSERHHHVIDTGPYRFVRHPGYSSALLLLAGMPLSLGSYWGLVPAALSAVGLVGRTSLEDRLLRAELPGYQEYATRVRWRLVPGLW